MFYKNTARFICPVVNNRSGVRRSVVGQSSAYDHTRLGDDGRDASQRRQSGGVRLA